MIIFGTNVPPGSIREKVAQFIDQSPVLSKYKGEKYYDLEDALVEFIEENRGLIADEVDREFQREDLIQQATKDYGDQASRTLPLFPIEKIDSMIEAWQESLEDNDDYWDAYWIELSKVLKPEFGGKK